MRSIINCVTPSLVLLFLSFSHSVIASEKGTETAANKKMSPETQTCIGCHKLYTPGIVEERRISGEKVSDSLSGYVVGCYECHSQNPENHKDNFEHMGFKMNVVVSPNDCKTCHPAEVSQFSDTKKAHSVKNLMANPVYHTLVSSITGMKKVENGKMLSEKPSEKNPP